MRRFSQVDVFSPQPGLGNPVAVVHDADGVDDDAMAAFARWTNLSETTFLLQPTVPDADYRLRIFTPAGELPFAGHPTLGSAHAWLEAGGSPATDGHVVQECEAGLIAIRRSQDRLAFRAPPLRRSGPVDEALVTQTVADLGIGSEHVLDAQWVDNGPGWFALLLDSPQAVLAIDPSRYDGIMGVVAAYPDDAECAFEVRAFAGAEGIAEDPVTGSLNAGLAQWLLSTRRAPSSYVAAQGTAMRRVGRVHVDQIGEEIWVGGHTLTVVTGQVRL